MTTSAPARHTVPGSAGLRLAALGDRAVLHDLYDETGSAVYHDLSAQDTLEVRELLGRVRTVPGPVLELAAGSGRLTFPLLALGRDVTALELSSGMLALLRQRLDEAPARIRNRCTTVHGDMSDFRLEGTFGAVVLGTTSISLLDAAGRAGLYEAVRGHLAPGGRFLLSTVERPADEAEGTDGSDGTDGADGTEGADDTEVVLDVVGASGRGYRMHEHWPAGADARVITVFPAEEPASGTVPVATSTVGVLPVARLTAELAAHGLTVTARYPLPSGGWRHRDVLLEAEVAA
ncbi:class I SAM-dependent methyltransferase [Streptomyces sp. NHF165]|uniref:daptide-type RiPP biosynthesis methyltransferase n=1 Tax=Streptomyces TaxID=1883 RepID=UPI00132EE808|nr:daptide-type RiPP biosynthesis methyltransferase [Streptomyces sp. NHF165]QHF97869.1 class I SAM-dependent methyltransferase [Streptomyces sp. NHF165]